MSNSDGAHGSALAGDEAAALGHLLDTIVPPSEDGALPGAGEVGLAALLDEKVPELRPLLRQALAALDGIAGAPGAESFGALAPAERAAALDEFAAREPGFLPGLLYHTYALYYQQPRVLEGLGFEARPPFPLGYELEAGDLSLLEPVRRRTGLYRDC